MTYVLESIQQAQAGDVPAIQALAAAGTYSQLRVFIEKTTGVIIELNNFICHDLLRDGKVSIRRWNDKNRQKLDKLKTSVQEARQNLNTALNSANLCDILANL